MINGLIALTLAAVFTAAAFYINVPEQPARLRLRPGPLLAQWQDSYARAVTLQSALALPAGALGIVYWWSESAAFALAGALLLLTNWPYTLIVIRPVNARLNALSPLAATAAFVAAIMRAPHFLSAEQPTPRLDARRPRPGTT
jgi:hypothetical protein